MSRHLELDSSNRVGSYLIPAIPNQVLRESPAPEASFQECRIAAQEWLELVTTIARLYIVPFVLPSLDYASASHRSCFGKYCSRQVLLD